MPTWSLCALSSTYSVARAGSEPGRIAMTFREAYFESVNRLVQFALTGAPVAPGASWPSGRPKIFSASDALMAAAGEPLG